MDWIESQLDDETIFPQKLGKFGMSIKLVGHLIFWTNYLLIIYASSRLF